MKKNKYLSNKTFKSASSLLNKSKIELVVDDFEVTAVDCSSESDGYKGENFGSITASFSDQKKVNRLYNKLMGIYSERVPEKVSEKSDEWCAEIDVIIAALENKNNGDK